MPITRPPQQAQAHTHTEADVTSLTADLAAKASTAALTTHTGDTANPHAVTKTHVGLGSADNTADTAKPVSTAQQTALDAKAPLASPAFTGTPTGITKSHVGLGSADNTSDTAKPVSTAQQTALDAKAPLVASYQLSSGEAVLDRIIGAQSTSVTTTSGVLALSYFVATKTETITQVRMASGGTAAGATPTLVRIGIWPAASDGSLSTLLASCASDTALFAAATTVYTKTLSSSFSKVAGTRYACGVLVVTAAAAPSLTGYGAASTATAGWDLAPRMAAVVNSQTDLPSTVAVGSLATTSRLPQFILLP